jgi:hypothetical protein
MYVSRTRLFWGLMAYYVAGMLVGAIFGVMLYKVFAGH